MIDPGALTKEFFESRIGGVFILETLPVVELTLERVASAGTPRPDSKREPFRLEFVGPTGLRMPQRTYRMRGAEGDLELEMFLVQTGDDAGGSRVEAVFS